MQERGLTRQHVHNATVIDKTLLALVSGLAWVFPLGLPANSAAQVPADPIRLVNVFIGSGSGPIGYGGTMPFVTPPFGMTDWTAQTRQNKVSVTSYKYEDTSISGFIGTHQPAIWMGDYGYVTLMPELDGLKTTPDERKLTFTHTDEIARPDYYSVSLQADDARRIRTEMTATTHCGYLRFTFPADRASIVMVEASRPGIDGFAQLNAAKREIVGYNPDRMDSGLGPLKLANFKGYFVIQFRQPFSISGTYGMGSEDSGKARGAYAQFHTRPGEAIEARVGTSFISIEQARANLQAEIPDWNFEKVRLTLRGRWNDKLRRVSLEGASEDQQRIIYTGLYHAMLYPRVFSEQGRYYSAFDDTVHKGASYTAYSIWDTFRAENSLLTLIAPERIDGMVQALLQNYQEGGWMPKWPNPSYTNIMIGTHADSLVAEAIRKGFHGFSYPLAWDAVYKDAINGKTFSVMAENNSTENIYIQSATLNGRPLTIPVIRWEDIMAGASLKVVMGPSPSRWAADWKPAPLSETLNQ